MHTRMTPSPPHVDPRIARARRRISDLIYPLLYPELRLCRCDDERRAAREQAQVRHIEILLALVMGGAIFIICRQLQPWQNALLGRAAQRLLASFDSISAIVAGLFCGYLMLYLTREHTRKRIRALLVHRGRPVCIECGYDTAAAEITPGQGVRCPECGTWLSDIERDSIEACARITMTTMNDAATRESAPSA